MGKGGGQGVVWLEIYAGRREGGCIARRGRTAKRRSRARKKSVSTQNRLRECECDNCYFCETC